MQAKEAAKEYMRRKEARRDILSFIDYLRPAYLPDFHWQPAKHHRVFAEVINRLLDALVNRTEEHDREAVSVPPGSAKSFYFSVTAPCLFLAADPSFKLICVSAGESLAEDFARRRRQILLSPQWQALAGSSLMPDAKGLGYMGTTAGGGIYAVGAGSTIQGLRADALFGDDLVTGHEEAASLSQLDKKWNWYVSEARARLRPGGVEALIATRWALLDPIGRVLRLAEKGHEHWGYTRIPMICDSDDDPVGRKLGERLYPEYFTARMVRDAQRNPLFWQTLYQQNPAVSEYSWVGLDHIHVRKRASFPDHMRYYIGVDISLGVQKGDYTVFAVIGLDHTKTLHLVDLYRKQADPNDTARAYLTLQTQYNAICGWVDNDNSSIMWGKIVEREASRQHLSSRLRLSKMKNRDKEVRAAPLRDLFMQNRIKLAEDDWTQLVLREVAEFPDGRNDDIVDAIGVVAKELHKLSGPPEQQLQQAAPPLVGSIKMDHGRMVTAQPLDELWQKPVNLGRQRRV